MIWIRTTTLEKFITCPYRYKHEPPPPSNLHAFKFGTALHKLVEINVQGLATTEAVDIIMHPFAVKDRKMLSTMCNSFMEEVNARWLIYIVSEYSFNHTFENLIDEDWDPMVLEWTFDILFKTPEWKYIIVDAKTAKSAWNEEHIDAVNQRRIYPALFKLCSDFNVDSFEYRVMKKTLTPNLQKVVFNIEENNEEIVEWFMNDLLVAEKEQSFPTNYPNYSCWFCKLRGSCLGAPQL